MDIMVIGGGGREHAIITKLRENPEISRIYALPGNAGMHDIAECVSIGAKDIDNIIAFAREKDVGFAVVAPDDPLVLGCVDALNSIGVKCFGPTARAAEIEGSKAFAKRLMKKYGIPTAAYEIVDDYEKALEYARKSPLPVVIKADGLALGKGVIIAQTHAEAEAAINSMMLGGRFGDSGKRVVIEEFLTGPEVSVLAFTDGETIIPMVSSMDHKRALDGDMGLNTGGMGAIAPNPYYTKAIAEECMNDIFLPTIRAMKNEGREFRGCLYFGLMLTPNGAKVIEYNCRFGDPEAQAVLPLLETDLFDIMRATANGKLKDIDVQFSNDACCCVIIASKGYPEAYETGFDIELPLTQPDEYIFAAGVKRENGVLKSAGGRVLGVTATAETLENAIAKAYSLCEKVRFENGHYRRDIGMSARCK